MLMTDQNELILYSFLHKILDIEVMNHTPPYVVSEQDGIAYFSLINYPTNIINDRKKMMETLQELLDGQIKVIIKERVNAKNHIILDCFIYILPTADRKSIINYLQLTGDLYQGKDSLLKALSE